MDDEIGKVVAALETKKMRDSTLIVFMSDNGGNTLSMLSGDADVSKLKLPADNGPYRGGKGCSTKAARESTRSPMGQAASRLAR